MDAEPLSISPGGTVWSTGPEGDALYEHLISQSFDGPHAPQQGLDIPPLFPDADYLAMTDQQEAEDDDEPATNASGKRAHRRAYECHYSGCMRRFDESTPFYCPHPDAGMPELDYTFCSAQCALGWALYEVGEPLCDRLKAAIEERHGGAVSEPAPPLHVSMDLLTLTDPPRKERRPDPSAP